MIGQFVSHYKILDKLGEGGMGIVYRAHDTKLDRTVALKFLPPQLPANDQDKTPFKQEARAAAALAYATQIGEALEEAAKLKAISAK